MATLDFDKNPKQGFAFLCLTDNRFTEIGYGGAGGGGKSWIGCSWIILMCLQFAGVTYGLGRKELTTLRKTTFVTFMKVCTALELIPDKHYTYNAQTNIVTFFNGSSVFLIDMAYKPSDPDYIRFGGFELTGAFIDESNECDIKAIDILKTRLGRGLNDKYNITPKMLETFNPSKNHVYSRYWIPHKSRQMPAHRIFIPALITDNPYISPMYIAQLENADEITRQRLLYGNFEYDDDDRALVSYENIRDCFSNTFTIEGKPYISSDLAMQGRDNFVVAVWQGLRVRIPIIKNKSTGKEIEMDLKSTAELNKVPRSQMIADSDGMGSYLESYIEGIQTFHANKTPFSEQYANLKNECAFKLAELIRKGLIFIDVGEEQLIFTGGKQQRLKDVIIEELSQLKMDNASIDKDQKKRIISKDEMKQNIGRSPDFLDVLIMRMYFEVGIVEEFVHAKPLNVRF